MAMMKNVSVSNIVPCCLLSSDMDASCEIRVPRMIRTRTAIAHNH
jgi:hypothetical protein